MWELIPFIDSLSQRGLHPIKLAYNHMSAGRPALLTASIFNWLGQYSSSHDNRSYCYAELAISSIAKTETVASTHCTYPQAELTWLNTKMVRARLKLANSHPCLVETQQCNRQSTSRKSWRYSFCPVNNLGICAVFLSNFTWLNSTSCRIVCVCDRLTYRIWWKVIPIPHWTSLVSLSTIIENFQL